MFCTYIFSQLICIYETFFFIVADLIIATKKNNQFPACFLQLLYQPTMLRTIFVLVALIVLVASEAEPEPEGEGEYAAAAEAEAEGGSATLTGSLLSLAFSLAFNAILRH